MAARQEGGEAMQSTEDSHATWPGQPISDREEDHIEEDHVEEEHAEEGWRRLWCGGKQIDDVNTLHKYKYIYKIRDKYNPTPIYKSKF